MKIGALVALAPALALGAVLLAPSVAEADHHRSSNRDRRSHGDRSYRGHDRQDRSHRQRAERGHRKQYSREHHRGYGRHGRYQPPRYRESYWRYRPRYYRPAPPVFDAPPPGYYAPPPAYYGPRGRVHVPYRPYRGGVHGSVSVGGPFFGLYLRF